MQKINRFRQFVLIALSVIFMALFMSGCSEKEVVNSNQQSAPMISIEKAMLVAKAPISVKVGQIIIINQSEPKWRIYLGRKDEHSAVISKDDKGFQQSIKFIKKGMFVVNTTSVITNKSGPIQPAPNVQKKQITFVVQ